MMMVKSALALYDVHNKSSNVDENTDFEVDTDLPHVPQVNGA
jgi:hypothetical protein